MGFVGKLEKAVWKVLTIVIGVGLVIGGFTWAFNNKQTFTAVAGSVGNAGASVVIASANWVAQQAGGSSSSAATVGPEVIYVQSKARAPWSQPLRSAVILWNRGLTGTQLKLGKCREGAPCIKVSQGSVFTPDGQPLRLGQTSTLFGKRITFNTDAVGQVPASYYAFAACHELGHALGLEHRAAASSCMHASARGAATHPDRVDYAKVNAEYGR